MLNLDSNDLYDLNEALKIENLRKELNLSEEHSKSLMKLLSEGKKNIK